MALPPARNSNERAAWFFCRCFLVLGMVGIPAVIVATAVQVALR